MVELCIADLKSFYLLSMNTNAVEYHRIGN